MFSLTGAIAPRISPRHWLGQTLDLVFPPACAYCSTEFDSSAGGLLCPACRDTLVDTQPACQRCGAARPQLAALGKCPRCQRQRLHFDSVVRLGGYEGALRTAVLRVKDQRQRGLAIALGKLLAAERGEPLYRWQPDAVVPIPMHWSRRIWRGDNSPETIAEQLAARLGVPLATHLLVRRRRTAPQASLSPRQRRANVRGAFRVRAHPDLPGARLLVVDDVMTTGATVNEAARALVRCGAAAVGVVVLARSEGLV